MDFGNALNALRVGNKVSRGPWIAEAWLVLSKDEPTIMIENGRGPQMAWTPSQYDVLATDWEIVD